MTDRELLEAAARAFWGDEIDDVVSVEWGEQDSAILYTHADNQDHNGIDRTYRWNPLEDDGDAFRLAVKVRIGMVPLEGGGWDCVRFDAETSRERPLASCANSGDWALRECIVRAAASLLPDGGPR